jgi:molecular chaperone Hsp33
MSDQTYTSAPPADFVLAFDLPQLGLRGRVVRMDAVSARALAAHALPEPAARVLGEALVLSTLLGSALKLDGRLTVQTKSDGPLNLVTVDYYGAEDDRSAGVRGFARLNGTQFAKAPGFVELAGSGVLAITIEPRPEGQTYQGIVELSAQGIAPSAET